MDRARNIIGSLISNQSSEKKMTPSRVRSMMTKGKLRLSVLEAKNLDISTQNAVRIYLNLVGQTYTTKSKVTTSKNGSFVFENDLLFFSISDRDVIRHLSLSVELVSAADMMGSRSSLGRVLIPLNDIVRKQKADDWFYLQGVDMGEIRLSWTYHGKLTDSEDVSAIEGTATGFGRHGSVVIRDAPKPFRAQRLSSMGTMSPGIEPSRSSRTKSFEILSKLRTIGDESVSPMIHHTSSSSLSSVTIPIMSPTPLSSRHGRRASSMLAAAYRSARRRERSMSSHGSSSVMTPSPPSSSSSSMTSQDHHHDDDEAQINTLGFDDTILGDEVISLTERVNAFKHDRCCERRANDTFRTNFLLSRLKSSKRSLNALRSAAWDGIPMYVDFEFVSHIAEVLEYSMTNTRTQVPTINRVAASYKRTESCCFGICFGDWIQVQRAHACYG